ncbi:MAG: HEAT repeat domain-containing protein [Polyangiales bacterium]
MAEGVEDEVQDDLSKVASDSVRRKLSPEVHRLITEGEYERALLTCDALIPYVRNDLQVLCNALWVVQSDNTSLPFDEAQARRFLRATVFRAKLNPPMHVNAAAVYAHFDDAEPVLRHLLLAKQHEQDLAPFLDDPLFDDFRTHARWDELASEDAGAEVREPTWIEVALEACEAREYASALPALLWFWSETRSSRVADLVDVVTERAGVPAGYEGAALEERFASDAVELLDGLMASTRWYCLRDGAPAKRGDEEDLVLLISETWDPRFAKGMLSRLRTTALPAQKAVEDGLQELFVQLEGSRDKRVAQLLREISVEFAARQGTIERWLVPKLERLAKTLDAMPEVSLSPDESRMCSGLEALLGPATPRELVDGESPSPPPLRAQENAVDPLLALWRRTRNPLVADVLDLQQMRDPKVPDLVREMSDAFIPGEGSERDVGAFKAAELVWEAKHRDDPRAASDLIRFFEAPLFLFAMRGENGVGDFWGEVLSTCVSLRDVRLVAPMRAFSGRVLSLTHEADAEAEADMYTAFCVGGFLKAQLAKSADELEGVLQIVDLDDAALAMLDTARREYAIEEKRREEQRLRTQERSSKARALLAAVIEDLDNDAPRLAYADFLGDAPRAEFIRLQIERARGGESELETEKLLQSEYEMQWVEPFSHLVEDLVFERGFVVRCTLDIEEFGDPLPPSFVGHPFWGTLEAIRSRASSWLRYDRELAKKVPSATVDAFAHPVMRSLKHLDGVSNHGLLELVHRGATQYELVTLEPSEAQSSPSLIATLCALPNLHTLRVRFPLGAKASPLQPLLKAEELSHLHFEVDAGAQAKLTPELAEALLSSVFERINFAWTEDNHDHGLDRCELLFEKQDGWSARAVQGKKRLPHDYEVAPRKATQFWLKPFMQRLDKLPQNSLRSFALGDGESETDALPSQASLDSLEALLASFPRLERVQLLPAGDSPERVQRLIDALEDDDDELAEHACHTLGSFHATSARDALVHHAVNNASLCLRIAAVEALAEIVDARHVPALCQSLDTSSAGWKQTELLGYLASPGAVPTLLEYARHAGTDFERRHVAQAFARIGDVRAVPILLETYALEHNAAVLVALGRLRAPEARPLALAALDLVDHAAGEHSAFTALGFVGQPEDIGTLERFFESREGVAQMRGIPLLASLVIHPQVSPARIEKMAGCIAKTWPRGEDEHLAWLALELHARLNSQPPPEWNGVRDALLGWCKLCLGWSERRRGELPHGLQARKHTSWEALVRSVEETWR